ncbi:hypothetical protein [Nitrososphaera viennensis]|uniref:Uncharacterized protein n=2 Tax=Nitrososphaera viennensis TaxID=1034015 RepID=A0A060HP58_9ARCH|nr:hypothetical protein [Nitrososphaera viennensis]AIC17278.1 exported protein of unknown function [Nitrososphaera viennensis EN76]UVS69161.1 hypothetical protein NWT39_14820 [Nitrososphaera viennensis]
MVRKLPVVAGIAAATAAGLAIFIFLGPWSNYVWTAIRGVPDSPIMYMIVNGKRHLADDNYYCGRGCEFSIYARTLSLPPIEIPRGSEADFSIDNRAISLRYHLLKYDDQRLEDSNQPLHFEENGKLAVDWPSGDYVISVIAGWDSINENQAYSLHRFRITVP